MGRGEGLVGQKQYNFIAGIYFLGLQMAHNMQDKMGKTPNLMFILYWQDLLALPL